LDQNKSKNDKEAQSKKGKASSSRSASMKGDQSVQSLQSMSSERKTDKTKQAKKAKARNSSNVSLKGDQSLQSRLPVSTTPSEASFTNESKTLDTKKRDAPITNRAIKLSSTIDNFYGASAPGFKDKEENIFESRGPVFEMGSTTLPAAINQNPDCDDTIVSEMTNPTYCPDKTSVGSTKEGESSVLPKSSDNMDFRMPTRQTPIDPSKDSFAPDPFEVTSSFFSSRNAFVSEDPFAASASQSNVILTSESASCNENFFSAFSSDPFLSPKSQQGGSKSAFVTEDRGIADFGDPSLEVVDMGSSDEEDDVDELAKTIVGEFQNESQPVPQSIATNKDGARDPIPPFGMSDNVSAASSHSSGKSLAPQRSSLTSPILLKKKRNEKKKRTQQLRESPFVLKPSDESTCDSNSTNEINRTPKVSLSTGKADETHLDPSRMKKHSISSSTDKQRGDGKVSIGGRSIDQHAADDIVPDSISSRNTSLVSLAPLVRMNNSSERARLFALKQRRNRGGEPPRISGTVLPEKPSQSKGREKRADDMGLEGQQPSLVASSRASQTTRVRSLAKSANAISPQKQPQSKGSEESAGNMLSESPKPSAVATIITSSRIRRNQSMDTARARSVAQNTSETPFAEKGRERSGDGGTLTEDPTVDTEATIVASRSQPDFKVGGTSRTRSFANNRASRLHDDVLNEAVPDRPLKTNQEPRSILKKPRRALPSEPSQFNVSNFFPGRLHSNAKLLIAVFLCIQMFCSP
jgi:hypothetical protein